MIPDLVAFRRLAEQDIGSRHVITVLCDEVERLRVLAADGEVSREIAFHFAAKIVAREAEIARLRSYIEGQVDRYAEAGEPVLPRGWTLVDGGRLDELEAEAARRADPWEAVAFLAGQPDPALHRAASALLALRPAP